MPTTSYSRSDPIPCWPKRFPRGSSPLKNLRANASLMTATCRDAAVSWSEMPRPRTIGVAEDLEISRRDAIPRRAVVVIRSWGGMSIHKDPSTPVVVAERRVVAERHAGHARNARHGLADPVVKRRQLVRTVIDKPRIDLRHHAIVLLESERLILQAIQGRREQPCRRQQHERQRRLEHNEDRSRQRARAGRRAAGPAKRLHRIGSCSHPRWSDAEGEPRHE